MMRPSAGRSCTSQQNLHDRLPAAGLAGFDVGGISSESPDEIDYQQPPLASLVFSQSK
jgi:hypothetical protein